MAVVTVFRHVPPPIIGMIGEVHDHRFESFEEHLDWLEATGTVVERFDPSTAPAEVIARLGLQERLSAGGDLVLPLVLVGETVVSTGAYPSRTELAHAVGQGARPLDRSAA
ncbi:MAG TPA: arsenic metallochaperone ArsD family protein [Vicinamibacteria bacterium]